MYDRINILQMLMAGLQGPYMYTMMKQSLWAVSCLMIELKSDRLTWEMCTNKINGVRTTVNSTLVQQHNFIYSSLKMSK